MCTTKSEIQRFTTLKTERMRICTERNNSSGLVWETGVADLRWKCVRPLRGVGWGGRLKLRGHDCPCVPVPNQQTLAVMRSRDNRSVPAEEAAAAAAALPYGLRIQSLSHYHSQNKHFLYVIFM